MPRGETCILGKTLPSPVFFFQLYAVNMLRLLSVGLLRQRCRGFQFYGIHVFKNVLLLFAQTYVHFFHNASKNFVDSLVAIEKRITNKFIMTEILS